MRVITRRSLIENVANRWKEAYCRKGEWPADHPSSPQKKEIYEQLAALDLKTASGAQVDAIIGNPTWTHSSCCECRSQVDDVLEMGDADYMDGQPATFCMGCVFNASCHLKIYQDKKDSEVFALSR